MSTIGDLEDEVDHNTEDLAELSKSLAGIKRSLRLIAHCKVIDMLMKGSQPSESEVSENNRKVIERMFRQLGEMHGFDKQEKSNGS